MKERIALASVLLLLAVAVFTMVRLGAAESVSFQAYEFATIRWAGKDNTHLIRPNGQIEMLGPILTQVNRPERADERALLMNVAMNAVAKEGYEFAGITGDLIVMRRGISR